MSDHSLLGTNTAAAAMEPNFQAQVQPCKRRKGSETGKTVITVRIEEDGGKLKNIGGHAFDHWSWRKYGQKAIKGSPYPRGYYKCTSRGCNAKKQVERSKTDDSTLVVTYTCTHNHPSPSLQGSRPTQQVKDHVRPKSLKQGNKAEEEEEEASQEDSQDKGSISFGYLLKSSSAQDMMIMEKEGYFQGNIAISHDLKLGFVLEEEPMISSCLHQHVMTSSALKSEGSDIFDELEDL